MTALQPCFMGVQLLAKAAEACSAPQGANHATQQASGHVQDWGIPPTNTALQQPHAPNTCTCLLPPSAPTQTTKQCSYQRVHTLTLLLRNKPLAPEPGRISTGG